MYSREAIYSALFAKLQASADFVTASRRLEHWGDVPSVNQPAIYLAQRGELAQTVPGQPTAWTLQVDVYLYASTTDKNRSPGEVLNPLIDAVVTAMAPDVLTGKCRLGGLVEHAVIDGRIETDEGALGDQGVAIIPITLKAL